MKKLNVLMLSLPFTSPNLTTESENNITTSDYIFPSLGIMSLSDILLSKKDSIINELTYIDFSLINCQIKEGLFIENIISDQLLNKANGKNIDVAMISLQFTTSYDFFKVVTILLKKIFPLCKIIVGGAHATGAIDILFSENAMLDYIVCGEGEIAISQLIDNIAFENKENIQGVHMRNSIKRLSNNRFETAQFPQDINVNFKNSDRFIDMDFYTKNCSTFSLSKTNVHVRSFPILASRGCPCNCSFCLSAFLHGNSARWRSLDNILDQIEWLYQTYNVSKIYLMDDNFTPKVKAIEFFNRLSKLKIPNFEIVVQNLSINHTDFDIIDAIVNAGVTYLGFAIESGNLLMQKNINKNCNLNKALKLVKYAKDKGCNVRCFYIIGFPNETIEQMDETIAFSKKVGADWSTFNVANPLVGTQMYNEFVNLGYINHSSSTWKTLTLRDRIFDTKEISADAIIEKAYLANLDVNFVHSPLIEKEDYINAEIVFKNFIKDFDFHIFAYDCLRRIYKLTGDFKKSDEVLTTMKNLMQTNSKAKEFSKYLYLLDVDIQKDLSQV